MEVRGILTPGTMNKIGPSQWQTGERLLVEVVQKTGDNNATIRVKGQNISAILETATELGDKFWVRVGDIKEGNLMLIREPLGWKQGNIPVILRQFQQLTERGLPNNLDIVSLLKTFLASNTGSLGLLMGNLMGLNKDLLQNLKKALPKWEELSEDNGAEELVECFRKLGLNYEQRIQLMLKLDPQAKELEKSNLRETFKYALLEALQVQEGEDLDDSREWLALMLEKITGQQLWFKTGAMDTAYMLLHLPLLNGEEILPVQIAIESARKGSKMDEKHCRVAIQIESQIHGEIGIDAYFNDDGLSIRVLTGNGQLFAELIEEVMPVTRENFSKLGFNITKIETGDLDINHEFQSFIQGSRRSGVDIQR